MDKRHIGIETDGSGKELEAYYFALKIPEHSFEENYKTEESLLGPAHLFEQDVEVVRILEFYNNSPLKIPVYNTVKVCRLDEDYYKRGTSLHTGNLEKGKLLTVELYERLIPEKINPLAYIRAIQLIERSNNGEVSIAEKRLAGKIEIKSFWDTVKFAAENPESKINPYWAAQAHRNEITVRRLEEFGFDTSASIFRS